MWRRTGEGSKRLDEIWKGRGEVVVGVGQQTCPSGRVPHGACGSRVSHRGGEAMTSLSQNANGCKTGSQE